MTVLIAIALLMSALSASAQLCSLQSGRVTCERLKGDTSDGHGACHVDRLNLLLTNSEQEKLTLCPCNDRHSSQSLAGPNVEGAARADMKNMTLIFSRFQVYRFPWVTTTWAMYINNQEVLWDEGPSQRSMNELTPMLLKPRNKESKELCVATNYDMSRMVVQANQVGNDTLELLFGPCPSHWVGPGFWYIEPFYPRDPKLADPYRKCFEIPKDTNQLNRNNLIYWISIPLVLGIVIIAGIVLYIRRRREQGQVTQVPLAPASVMTD